MSRKKAVVSAALAVCAVLILVPLAGYLFEMFTRARVQAMTPGRQLDRAVAKLMSKVIGEARADHLRLIVGRPQWPAPVDVYVLAYTHDRQEENESTSLSVVDLSTNSSCLWAVAVLRHGPGQVLNPAPGTPIETPEAGRALGEFRNAVALWEVPWLGDKVYAMAILLQPNSAKCRFEVSRRINTVRGNTSTFGPKIESAQVTLNEIGKGIRHQTS